MAAFYPLRLEPVFRQYLWGGRRLGSVLGKPIGAGEHYAESWEVVDHGDDQSRIASGPLSGQTLGALRAADPQGLMGEGVPADRFPLLFKFLDCQRNLSVQVHPNDQQAAQLERPDFGKTEAWYILDAQPGARLYAGLKRGFDRHALEREVTRGTAELCLHVIHPQVGDTLFIPAGTVHALGAGLLVAEIQQASDTTFRLYDWNRLGPDGQPRQLHVQQALEVIDYQAPPVEPQQPQPTHLPYAEQLVACDKFVLQRWHPTEPVSIGGDGKFRIVAVLQGSVQVEGDLADSPLGTGETMLLPAACGSTTISPAAEPVRLLVMSLP